MKAAEIRSKFLKYFESKGHSIVPSSSLVPINDPTLLFVNSGMVQFKDVFLGADKRPYTRATSAQRSVRAGGKHNDLENVGYTARHHTFFEMLGNFSFGDYFKREAIHFAWQLLTDVYQLPKEKLWTTVYAEDDEAYDIWTKEIGVPPERCVRIGDNKGARYASDNFWQMAETGPCGPCSEIFYDHGEEVWGGPPGSPDADGDRYIEIWNLVFMQFERYVESEQKFADEISAQAAKKAAEEAGKIGAVARDGTDYKLTIFNQKPLPKPCVDTGMGLERLAAILQHVHSNYEIDLFQNLIKAAARETSITDLSTPSLKVIADHIRACAFLVVDGVTPSNEGRGYVLRRIIRRAIRHGYKLGVRQPFFFKLVADLSKEMGEAYPELTAAADRVGEVLCTEEEQFFRTISHGMKILESALHELERTGQKVLDGKTAFNLHDTHGFPGDLTADVCREHGMSVDEEGFDRAMEEQRDRSREGGGFEGNVLLEYSGVDTRFCGYDVQDVEDAKVLAIYRDGAPVDRITVGEKAIVVLDRTPFYAQSGGQMGDAGDLMVGERGSKEAVLFKVEDTQKIQAQVFGHTGHLVTGALNVGDTVAASVDPIRRAATALNHSATHLMHKALREVLGSHVQQKGSQVDSEKTRFDFSHGAPLTDEEIRQVELMVNLEILSNAATQAREMPIDEAQKLGAMMLFGEKYGDTVRVLDIGASRELCGGTHVKRTGDIGFFKIATQSGVSAGVRRVEAVTGLNALVLVRDKETVLGEIEATLKTPAHEAPHKIALLLEQVRTVEKELAQLKGKLASGQSDQLIAHAVDVKGVKVLAAQLDGADVPALREAVDKLRDKLGSAAVVLAAVQDGKVSLIAGVTKDLVTKIKAGELVNVVAQQVGGKGGGRPDMAQAGGTDATHLFAALASVKEWVSHKL